MIVIMFIVLFLVKWVFFVMLQQVMKGVLRKRSQWLKCFSCIVVVVVVLVLVYFVIVEYQDDQIDDKGVGEFEGVGVYQCDEVKCVVQYRINQVY